MIRLCPGWWMVCLFTYIVSLPRAKSFDVGNDTIIYNSTEDSLPVESQLNEQSYDFGFQTNWDSNKDSFYGYFPNENYTDGSDWVGIVEHHTEEQLQKPVQEPIQEEATHNLGFSWTSQMQHMQSEIPGSLPKSIEDNNLSWNPVLHSNIPEVKEETVITVEKNVKVPYPVIKEIPYPVEKVVPFPVKVQVPTPYKIEKEIPMPYKVEIPVPVPIPRPVPVEKFVKMPMKYIMERPYPIKYQVSQSYPIAVSVPIPYHIKVPQPYAIINNSPFTFKDLVPMSKPIVPMEQFFLKSPEVHSYVPYQSYEQSSFSFPNIISYLTKQLLGDKHEQTNDGIFSLFKNSDQDNIDENRKLIEFGIHLNNLGKFGKVKKIKVETD